MSEQQFVADDVRRHAAAMAAAVFEFLQEHGASTMVLHFTLDNPDGSPGIDAIQFSYSRAIRISRENIEEVIANVLPSPGDGEADEGSEEKKSTDPE